MYKLKYKINLNRIGALSPRSMVMFAISLAILGSLITSGLIFSTFNTSQLTAAGAPTFLIATGGIAVAAVLLTWVIRQMK